MKTQIKQYIVTRFAIKVGFAVPSRDTDPEWIASRIALLQKYTLPSIVTQSNKDFTWLLMVSKDCPETAIEPLRKMLLKNFAPERARVARIKNAMRGPIIEDALASGAARVLTSRIDSDDALHTDFTADLRGVCEENPGKTFIEFYRGFSYDQATKSLRRMQVLNNPFVSLVEPCDDKMTTVYCGHHGFLREQGTMKTLDTTRWLQVVHGANQRNHHPDGPEIVGSAKKRVLMEFGIGHVEV